MALDFLKRDKEDAQLINAEDRQKDFIRERDAVRMSAGDEQTYNDTQEKRADLLKWQQDFNEELIRVYHELLSEHKTAEGWVSKKYKEWDQAKKLYVDREIPPLCTPQFAEKLIRVSIRPLLNKNTINSNLDDKRIIKLLRNTHNDIVGAISDGWGMHGIHSLDDANTVVRMIKNYVDPAVYRALNGWTKKTDSTIFKRIEGYQETGGAQAQKKGIWGLFTNG